MNLFRHNLRFIRPAIVTSLVFGVVMGPIAPLTAQAAIVTPAPQTFTFSTPGATSWNVPAGAASVRVQTWGAGGSGGNGASGTSGAQPGRGGGAGGYAESSFAVTAGSSHTITVGQGGQATSEGVSRNGGDSSFDNTVVATGGVGGLRSSTEGTNNPPSTAVNSHCDYEGTWVYHDQGGQSNGNDGNDFGVTCRGQRITGFCQVNSVTSGLDRGLHAGNYLCEGGSTPSSGIACDFEGSWEYNDEGGGNDFALTCRNAKVTGFCGATSLPRGFSSGNYTCEYGSVDDGATRCNFDGTWSYNDEGSGNDFAFTCHNSHITGFCPLTPLQRGGPQATYTCENYSTPINNTGGGTGGGGFGDGTVQLNLRSVANTLASAFIDLFKPAVAFADMIFNSAGGQGLHGDILQNGADGAALSGQTGSAGGSAPQVGGIGGVGGAPGVDGAAPGAGGGGGTTGNGGNGGNGRVIVTVTFASYDDGTGNGGGGTNPPPTGPNHAPNTPNVTWVGTTANSATVFTATATDPDGDQISYGFDWNSDGIVDQWNAFVPSGTSDTASHTFTSAGSYPIQVFVRDAAGLLSTPFTGTVVITNVVTPPPGSTLAVTISTTPTSAAISAGGLAIISISSIVTGNINPITHHGIEVSFNGGAYANAGAWPAPVANVLRTSNASFTALALTQPGSYNFRTYTSENNGATYVYSAPQLVTITQIPTPPGTNNPPVAPTVTWTASTTNVAGVFTATATDPDGDQISYGFDWNNDGIPDVFTASLVNSGVSGTISHTFTAAGSYPIQVFTRDAGGLLSPAFTGTVVINNPVVTPPPGTNNPPLAPIVTWTASTTNVAGVFTASSTDPDGDQITYGFDWNNDGVPDVFTPSLVNSGVADTISHTFTVAGSYPIQVFARDAGGLLSPAFTGTVVIVDPSTGGTGGGSTGGGTTGGGSMGTGGGGGGGSGGPCAGYGCSTPTTTVSVIPEQDVTINIGGGGGAPVVSGPELVCPIVNFLTVFMKKGIDNNPNEVRKLQYFLNTHENAGLPLSGDFDDATENAVKAFQAHYAADVLSPWGTTTPTGIVYITTTRKINEIYCAEHPGYNGNADLTDTVIDNNVLNTPDNSGQFQGVVGQATSTSSNIAGVFGAITGRLLDFLRSIPLYQWLILLLLLLAIIFTLKGTFQKDIASYIAYAAFMRGLAVLIVASVLNVLNTLSFMLNPGWLADKTGLTLPWVLGLDIANLLAVIIICLGVLIALYGKLSNLDKGPSTPAK